MRLRERCPCGGHLDITADNVTELAGVVMDWRDTHPCPARQRGAERDTAGSSTEQTYTAPHRLDAELRRPPRPLGFTRPPEPRGPVD